MSAAKQTKTVLVVDDDRKFLRSMSRLLKRSQLHVLTACGGRRGLAVAKCTPPDLVIVDVNMPGMSGHEFLRRFRSITSAGLFHNVEYCRIPVIITSGDERPQTSVAALNANADDFIAKSMAHEEIRARVRRLLRTRSSVTGGDIRRAKEHSNTSHKTASILQNNYALTQKQVLCVADDELLRERLVPVIYSMGCSTLTARSLNTALMLLKQFSIEVVICDERIARKGIRECQDQIARISPGTKVIFIADQGEADCADSDVPNELNRINGPWTDSGVYRALLAALESPAQYIREAQGVS